MLSHLLCFHHDWLEKKAQIDTRWMRVWATNRVGLFSILVVNAVHWCVLIRLRECSVLWITVFPSLPLPMVRASSSSTVLLPDDTAPFISCLSNSTECSSIGCVHSEHGCVDGWVCACVCVTAQYVLSSQRNTTNKLQAAGVMKIISDVRGDLFFHYPPINEWNISTHKSAQHLIPIDFRLTTIFSLEYLFLFSFLNSSLPRVFSSLWSGLNYLTFATTIQRSSAVQHYWSVSCHNISSLYEKSALLTGL